MSRGLFYLQIKVLSGFLHFMESKCWFGQCQKVLNSPFENESRPSSPGKRASRNLTRSGLLSTPPLLVSPGHNGRHDRFGRGLARERERERWRKETGTRRRGKNRHWQKTDMTAWQANKEIYLINKYIYTNIAIHFIGRNSELRDWSWCWPKLFSVKWNNFKWSAEVTLVVWEYNICLISFVNPDSCSGEIS